MKDTIKKIELNDIDYDVTELYQSVTLTEKASNLTMGGHGGRMEEFCSFGS